MAGLAPFNCLGAGPISRFHRLGPAIMPDRLTLLSALAAVLLVLPQGAAAQDRVVPPSAEALRMSYAPIVKRVVPAVVTVSAAKTVENRNPLLSEIPVSCKVTTWSRSTIALARAVSSR